MASSSRGGSQMAMGMKAEGNYQAYPAPMAEYSQVVANPQLFMSTLEKLHSTMATKFMIPIIGGKELDLHRLFVEVTSRGGIEKIIRERKWKDVTATFNFPSTATNASFVLRKYYVSLLQHYEQIYFFRAKGWTPMPAGNLQSSSIPIIQFQRIEPWPTPQHNRVALTPQPRIGPTELPRASSTTNSEGTPVVGVIDGKFDDGYLVTVSVGTEKLKGVLYQIPPQTAPQQQQPCGFKINDRGAPAASVTVHRRRRRKKSEIKRRDPAHPKPNRSGYNFFFAEQHARLKPLHPGKDREISRMIGELWNKLKESERAVYQEKAMKDKERYKAEMEHYREKQRLGQVISDAVPLQQRLPELDAEMAEADTGTEEAEGDSPQTPYNESSTGKSNSDDFKDTEASLGSGAAGESSNDNMVVDAEGPATQKNEANNTGDKLEKGEGAKADGAANPGGPTGEVNRNGEGIERSMEMKKESKEV